MPQGKGTYGSQVGRPPKKEKYQGGGSIDPFSTKNPDSVVTKQALEEMKDQADIQTSNAQERNETSPMGAEVGTGVYKEGGKVDVTDIVKEVESTFPRSPATFHFPDKDATGMKDSSKWKIKGMKKEILKKSKKKGKKKK